jgi:hypothetical protein
MENIVLSIGPQEKVWKLSGPAQLFMLLTGLPAGFGSLDTSNLPNFAPDLLKLAASASLWAATRWLNQAERLSK